MPRVQKVTRQDDPRPVELDLQIAAPDLPAVLICRDVLSAIYSHANEGYPNEIGGYYVGLPLIDVKTGVRATYIEQSVEAITTGNRTHVIMHPESFRAVIPLCERTGTLVVGYYHSHPALSVFQSGTDTTYFGDYHSEPYQIAIVVDPTLTTQNRLSPWGEWIGFFAWDQQHRPTRLPNGNILIVQERPALLDHDVRSPQHRIETRDVEAQKDLPTTHIVTSADTNQLMEAPPITESEARELAQLMWQATHLLLGKLHPFDPNLPILLIPTELMDALGNYTLDERRPCGLLEGVSWVVADYNFICVMGTTPTDVDTLQMYSAQIGKTRRRATIRLLLNRDTLSTSVPVWQIPTSLQGLNVVGLEGDRDFLLQSGVVPFRKRFSIIPELEQSSQFALSCGDYCLLAVRSPADATARTNFRFTALRNRDGRLLDVPASHIVIL